MSLHTRIRDGGGGTSIPSTPLASAGLLEVFIHFQKFLYDSMGVVGAAAYDFLLKVIETAVHAAVSVLTGHALGRSVTPA